MNDQVSKVLEESKGPEALSEDCFKIAEIFAKETGQEFLLKFFKDRCDMDTIKMLANRVYAIALMNLLDSIKTTMPMGTKETKETH